MKIIKILATAIIGIAIIFSVLIFETLDYAKKETLTIRLTIMLFLVIITGSILWLIYTKKKLLMVLVILIAAAFVFSIWLNFVSIKIYQPFSSQTLSNRIPDNNSIKIFSPRTQEIIKNPLFISGEAQGIWFFEAQFTAELYDANKNFLGRAILTAKNNWMNKGFIPFEGDLNFIYPSTSLGTLKFLSANPSGLPDKQLVFEIPVQFEKTLLNTRKVLLYYYKPEKDKDNKGNIKCSKDGLIAIEREIPITQNPIQDTIKLLIKGKENLTEADISQGITTEYPLEGFSLTEVNLKNDSTLILKFNDYFNKTSGGACRTAILWFQIEATAKQYPEVKNVQFLPNWLFQP